MKIIKNLILVSSLLATAITCQNQRVEWTDLKNQKVMENQKYTGMWVTGDGYIRQELLPDGRYDEARGNRRSAYTGRYEIKGTYIYYWDDTGFEADGNFINDSTLSHGGYTFYRESKN